MAGIGPVILSLLIRKPGSSEGGHLVLADLPLVVAEKSV